MSIGLSVCASADRRHIYDIATVWCDVCVMCVKLRTRVRRRTLMCTRRAAVKTSPSYHDVIDKQSFVSSAGEYPVMFFFISWHTFAVSHPWMHNATLIITIPSVRPYMQRVNLSVIRYCARTAEDIVEMLSAPDSPTLLVLLRNSNGLSIQKD